MYNAELQLLREFWWYFAPTVLCEFCNLPLCPPLPNETWGHRRHPKVRATATVHHEDENRNNNARANCPWSHSDCHKRYHTKKRGVQYGTKDGTEEGNQETTNRKEGEVTQGAKNG